MVELSPRLAKLPAIGLPEVLSMTVKVVPGDSAALPLSRQERNYEADPSLTSWWKVPFPPAAAVPFQGQLAHCITCVILPIVPLPEFATQMLAPSNRIPSGFLPTLNFLS